MTPAPPPDRAGDGSVDVALVSMPWAPPTEPCLGLGILKACLQAKGIAARVFHMAPELLRWCTLETYAFLADLWGLDDFLFTGLIDDVIDDRQRETLQRRVEIYARLSRHSRYVDAESILGVVRTLRDRIVPDFIDDTVRRVLAVRPKLVGLTCLFDQTMASVALARRLKQAAPDTVVVLGGYALEGPPGVTVAQAFPWIDLVVLGDGEQAIVELAQDVLAGRDVGARANASARIMTAARIELETSPEPDYDDWFSDLEQLATTAKIRINTKALPVESSRGCWWGQKQHCIFCGIDDETLKYRQKTAPRTLAMLAAVHERYGDHIFRFSDYIMPKEYYKTLLPVLAQQETKYRLHSEVKANHPPERVKLLADAGFREIQPGIESFSTPVLKAINKGVTAILNVSLIKAGYVNGIVVNYNIIYGFPADAAADYREMLKALPQLYHLIPPVTCTEVGVTRFAPLQSNPVRFGIRAPNVHHHCYDMMFSREFLERSGFCLDSYGYFFERRFEYPEEHAVLYRQLGQQVDHWKKLHQERRVELSFDVADGLVSIVDSRHAKEQRYCLSRAASAIYLECDARPAHVHHIRQRLDDAGCGFTESGFAGAIEELVAARLIWREGDQILGLAVPRSVWTEHTRNDWFRTWVSVWH